MSLRHLIYYENDSVEVVVPSGSYSYSGLVPTLLFGLILEIPTGSYSYSGQPPVIDIQNNIFLEIPTGSYSYKGFPPVNVFAIDITATSSDRTIRVLKENRKIIVNSKKEDF